MSIRLGILSLFILIFGCDKPQPSNNSTDYLTTTEIDRLDSNLDAVVDNTIPQFEIVLNDLLQHWKSTEAEKWGAYYSAKNLNKNANSQLAILLLDSLEAETQDKRLLIKINRRLGHYYNDAGVLNKALLHDLKTLRLLESSLDSNDIAVAHNSVGEDYRKMKSYQKAINQFEQGIAYVPLAEYSTKARLLNNLGLALAGSEQYKAAKEAIASCKRITEEFGNQRHLGMVISNYAFVFYQEQSFEEAIPIYREALEYKYQQKAPNTSIAYTLNDIGHSYFHLGQFDSAIKYSSQAIQMIKPSDNIYYAKDMSASLADAFGGKGQYDSAFYYQEIYQELSDNIFNESSYAQIASTEVLHERQLERNQNALLKLQNDLKTTELRKQGLLIIIGLLGLALLAVYTMIILRSNRSKRKLTERLGRKVVELDKTNTALQTALNEQESLFNIVVHDLKAPLNNAKNLRSLDESGWSEEKKISKQQMVDRSIDSALGFIQDFNLLMEFEQKQQLPDKTKVNLTAIINDSIANFQQAVAAKNLKFVFNNEEEVAMTCVSSYLRHIIHNLVSNAVKYTLPNTSIFITISQSETLSISIEDQGPGIPKELQHRIFERFYRGTEAEAGQSNGLGLSLVKLLVAKLKGTIRVNSKREEGAEFVVRFPIE